MELVSCQATMSIEAMLAVLRLVLELNKNCYVWRVIIYVVDVEGP
jgi:hypothetical protein